MQKINVDQILAKINIPKNLKPMYDKVLLSGMRILFDKSSHQMMLDELSKPGPMAKKIADGIIGLMYLLWTKSNGSIPPQLIVPVTTALTLESFRFLQDSGDPEATKETLGDAMDLSVNGIMAKFGVTEQNLPDLIKNQGGNQQPKAGGLLMEGV